MSANTQLKLEEELLIKKCLEEVQKSRESQMKLAEEIKELVMNTAKELKELIKNVNEDLSSQIGNVSSEFYDCMN
jgi:gas vesicle protein